MKKKRNQAQLPFRLNILFLAVFGMFFILIIQLGFVQILKGESYQEAIDATTEDITKNPVPRGRLYDRNYNVVVDNKPLYSITYTPPKGIQEEEKLKVAKKLSEFITLDKDEIPKISDRNKREYWYLNNEEEAMKRITDKEKEDNDDGEQYQLALEKITEEEVESLTEKDMEIIAIKREFDKAYALSPQIVKNEGVTMEEYSQVAEHLDILPGVNATTDWERDYPYKDTFKPFFGSITSQKQGIPADNEQYYLTRGYSRNDRVGRSGLELYYEDLLKGRKEQVEHTTTNSGKVVGTKVLVPGERGKDLVLTVDMEFQEKVDEIVREELKKTKEKYPQQNQFLTDALAVVMNPKTGEIYAISGQSYNKDNKKYENQAYKALYDAHEAGSSIKGATILAGYQSGVITPNEVIFDTPVKIQGTPPKGSYLPLGSVNDLTALKRSSNVYMFHIAMRMGGEFNYTKDKSIRFNTSAFQDMRSYFSQFGLGVETGIDFPNESTGVNGGIGDPGNLMDLGIGQFDTYTTLQLAQYVSTIANDGYRVRPHLLKEVRTSLPNETDLGPVYESVSTDVMNRVQMSDEHIKRVQDGFWQVYQETGGTAASTFKGVDYKAAGKTGTAEREHFKDGVKYDIENHTLVGYAPFDDPEVAFAVIVPGLGKHASNQLPVNRNIGKRILDTYFEMYDRD